MFLAEMERMLGEEYQAFLASSRESEILSLRVNLLKGSAQKLAEQTDFLLEEVPWAKGGFYYRADARPGRHPFHEAGAYYIQEASAMAPAAALGARPGERVLDLCAAPGGKSTQLASDMKGEGLLVSNEIHPARARILSENIERMGIRNCLVVNHEPAFLSRRFPQFFDRILVDAPCSGEGMFRKSEQARREWSPETVKGCTKRQADILDQAARMLKEGGRLVYSTCTFSVEENEETVLSFLERHPEFEPEEAEFGFDRKEADSLYRAENAPHLPGSMRFFPHRVRGEGHFLSCLRRKESREGNARAAKEESSGSKRRFSYETEKGISEKEYRSFVGFEKEYLTSGLKGDCVKFGEQLYLLPEETPLLKGLKVLRPGLHLGAVRKERFEPSHALALYLKPGETRYRYELSKEEAGRYLRGETFPAEGEKGWYLITVGGYGLGWGKLAGGIMKNHYPKGLRK